MPKDETPAPPPLKTARVKRVDSFVLPDEGWFAPAEEHPDNLSVLYFGREGSTKTTSGAAMANLCPEGSKILVVNAEGGLKVKPLQKLGIDTSKLNIYPRPEQNQPTLSFPELKAVFRRIAAELHADPNAWFGTIWDSTSRLASNLLDESAANRVRKLKRRAQQAGRPEDDVNEWFTDRDDYGVMTKKVRTLLHEFHALNCHWVGTALMRRDIDEDTKKPMYGPAVNAALADTLLGDPDVVIAMVGEDELGPPRGLTRGNTRYRAKDRFHVLPRVMAVPTFERITAYYEGQLVEEEDPEQKALTADALASFDAPRGGDPAKDEEEDEDDDD